MSKQVAEKQLHNKKTKTKLIETNLPCTNDVEAFTALLNGYVIKFKSDGDILRFKENRLVWDKEGPLKSWPYWECGFVICKEEQVEVNWYDEIPEQGILCKVSKDVDPDYYAVIIAFKKNQFLSTSGNFWNQAIPVSYNTISNLLYENQIS